MRTLSLDFGGNQDIPISAGTCIYAGSDCYQIENKIGQGGFGAIYSARLDGHHYALKIAAGGIPVKKLEREAETTAILSRYHAGILPIRILPEPEIGIGEERRALRELTKADTRIGVIRDMSEAGVMLADLLKDKRMDIVSATEIMMSLLRVLEPIHEKEEFQYIHGDISPENIIFVPSLTAAFFIDFGNSQKLENGGFAEIARDEVTFNPIFMPPEIRSFVKSGRDKLRLTKASDIFSLAMIFYALLFETPDPLTCEHIAVLAHNRVNESFSANPRDKALALLLTDFFDDCFAASVQYRMQDVMTMRMRLTEIRNVSQGIAITKAGLRARVIESGVFGVQIDLHPENLLSPQDLSRSADPLFLYGVRGSGKTALIKALGTDLLEEAAVVPLLISADEVSDISPARNGFRGLAQAVYRRYYGGINTLGAEGEDIDALCELLGFAEATTDRPDAASRPDVSFVLIVTDAQRLADKAEALAALAKVMVCVTKTKLIFSGKASLAQYGDAAFRSCFAEARILQTFREEAKEGRTDAEVFLSLDRLHKGDRTGAYSFLPALAYQTRVVKREDTFVPEPGEEDTFRNAVWDGLFVAAGEAGEGERRSFASQALSDYCAAQYIVGIMLHATAPENLHAVNHLWSSGVLRMLRAMPQEERDAVAAHAESLIPGSSHHAVSGLDLLPANLFAVTGDVKWARLSLEVADEFFHDEILDGYFAYGSSVILCADLRRAQTVWYDFSEYVPPESVSRWPERMRQVLASDLRYGYRLEKNPALATALLRANGTRGRRFR
jgi:serine/threonine protein kinase